MDVPAREYVRIRHREIYRNRWLGVELHDIVHPSGVHGEHLLVRPSPPCGVLVQDDEHFIFTVQPRFAAEEETIEIVKGGANDGESPLDCAKRELQEELGIAAERWSSLGAVHEIPSIVAPPVTIFLARSLRFGAAEEEPEESIRALRMTIEGALDAVASGTISDGVTMAALLRFVLREGRLAAAMIA